MMFTSDRTVNSTPIYLGKRQGVIIVLTANTISYVERQKDALFVNMVLLDSGFMWHTSLFVICLWGPKCFHPFLVPSPGVSWERISPSVWSLLTCLSQIHRDFCLHGSVWIWFNLIWMYHKGEWAVSINTKVNWSPWQIFDSISFRSDKTRQP